MVTPRTGRPRGRPRIQETADRVVAGALAAAGARIDEAVYSTRALAERTGLSQTAVSRAVRRVAGAGAGEGGRTAGTRIVRVRIDSGECGVEFASADALPRAPADAPPSSARHLRRRAALLAALGTAGADLPARLPGQLADCAGVPHALLEALKDHVVSGDAEFTWEDPGPLPLYDSGSALRGEPDRFDRGPGGLMQVPGRLGRQRAWLPRAGTSATEQLAVRLRDAIIDTGLRPGDRLSAARAGAMLDVPRTKAAEVLRRMVDDEILDGSAGDVRIPQASADDVIELYAARMLLGDVLLRAAAHRPRRYLLPARRALDAVEHGAASGAHVDDADLRFQQEWARASGLEQTVRLFESSTVRVRMLIAVLRLDYARAATSILRDDRAVLAALAAGDAAAAVRAWHRKIDGAVRHMHGRARNAAFDVELWNRLTTL